MDKAHFAITSPVQNLAKLAMDLAKLIKVDQLATMWELSIDNILAAIDSNDEEGEEEDDEEEDEQNEEMEEGEIPPPHRPTFRTTGTNTNPFTLKWGKTIGGNEKKEDKEKKHPEAAFGQAAGVCPSVKHSRVRSGITGLSDLEVGSGGL